MSKNNAPPTLGFLKLDTRFPRLDGDAGCARTWPFPVIYHTVVGGTPKQVIQHKAAAVLRHFIDGGRQLAAQGVVGIATTCGFLALHQQTLAAALPVPVMSSALLYGRHWQSNLADNQRLGILTVSAADLSAEHLAAAAIPPERVVVGGLPPDSHLAKTLLQNLPHLDAAQAQQDMLAAAQHLCRQYPDIGALLLECANMPPYAAALEATLGIKVFSLVDAVIDFYDGLPAAAKHVS